MALNSTPRTWVAGEIVTDAELNAEIRDALTGIQAAWTAYTPGWSASTTNPTLGNGTLVGRMTRIGKTVLFSITLTMGSTTTFGAGQYSLSLPTAQLASQGGINAGVWLNDNSAAANQAGTVNISSSTTVRIIGSTAAVTPTSPWTWATADVITVNGTYEAP